MKHDISTLLEMLKYGCGSCDSCYYVMHVDCRGEPCYGCKLDIGIMDNNEMQIEIVKKILKDIKKKYKIPIEKMILNEIEL